MTKKQQRDRELAVKRYLKREAVSAIATVLNRSRPGVYKWVEHYEASSAETDWRAELTRAPHTNPRQLSPEVVEAVNWPASILTIRGCFVARRRSVGNWRSLASRPYRASAPAIA